MFAHYYSVYAVDYCEQRIVTVAVMLISYERLIVCMQLLTEAWRRHLLDWQCVNLCVL